MSELEKMLQREVLPVDSISDLSPEQEKKVSQTQAIFQNIVDEIATGKVNFPEEEQKLH